MDQSLSHIPLAQRKQDYGVVWVQCVHSGLFTPSVQSLTGWSEHNTSCIPGWCIMHILCPVCMFAFLFQQFALVKKVFLQILFSRVTKRISKQIRGLVRLIQFENLWSEILMEIDKRCKHCRFEDNHELVTLGCGSGRSWCSRPLCSQAPRFKSTGILPSGFFNHLLTFLSRL